MGENREYISKLIDIANAIIFYMINVKNGRVILIGGKQSKIIKKNIFFSCVCIKCIYYQLKDIRIHMLSF